MEVTFTNLDTVRFLTIKHPNGKRWSVPLNRIRAFNFGPETVEIVCDNPDDNLDFAHDNRDAIAAFLDARSM